MDLGELSLRYTKIGRTDQTVSRICLGTMTWGAQNNESDGHQQMDYAIDQGVNFLDTAEIYPSPASKETYGTTETIIGNWFTNRKNRDKIILATKIIGAGFSYVRDGRGIDRKNIQEAVENSLKRLRTDYIDLYQLHWPNRGSYHFQQFWSYTPVNQDHEAIETNLVETLETLGDLVQQGKIRHIGLSNDTAWGVMRYLHIAKEQNLPRIASVSNEYNLLCRHYDNDLAEISWHENVSLLPHKPLAAGLLSGKYQDGRTPKGTRGELVADLNGRITPTALDAMGEYLKVADKHGLDPCQMALAFILTRSFTASVIIGATKISQLKTNIDSIDIHLSEEVLSDISAVYRKYPIPY